MRRARNVGLDFLKAISIAFVLILHVAGYYREQFDGIALEVGVEISWHFLETIAYPAIHIFVLISCFFWIDRVPSWKSGIKVWLQTFMICIIGLAVAVILRLPIGIKDIIVTIFPFMGRAYWFVTDYLFLFIIAPLLKRAIDGITGRQLSLYTLFLVTINSGLCFLFPFFSWNQDYSNIGLFICLFFIAAWIKQNIDRLSRKLAGIIWIICIMVMVASYFVATIFVSKGIMFLSGKEELLYTYNSPVVILQASSIFVFFAKTRMREMKVVSVITNASLIVYLIHMHPILKQFYVQKGVLNWMDTQNAVLFLAQVIVLVLAVYIIGIIVSWPVLFTSEKLGEILYNIGAKITKNRVRKGDNNV